MSAQDLRRVFLDLLADLRSVGRGASRGAIGELFDRRLPAMLSAFDGHAGERVAQTSRDRILQTVVTTTRARIELHGEPSASLNGQAHGISWPWQRATMPRPAARRWSWGLGLAGAAALLMVGWMLYSALSKPIIVKHEPKSGTSVPIPKGPEKRPDGPVVKGGTPPEKKLVPKPGPKKQETLVVIKQPEVGKLGSVMGEPLVYAAGSKKGLVAKRGMTLAMGATIETGDADKLELKLTDGTVIRLDFNTRIVIPRAGSTFDPRPSTLQRPDSITLDGGRLYAMVTHQEDGNHFKVKTPAATAEVLGTEFGLKVERLARRQDGFDYKTTLQVKRGKVRFYNEFGEQTATDSTESWATDQSRPIEPKRVEVLSILRLAPGHSWVIESSRLDAIEGSKRFATAVGYLGPDAVTFAPGRVKIVWSRNGSPAQLAGLRAGDILLSFDGRPIGTAEQFLVATYLSPRKPIRLGIEREGHRFEIVVKNGVYNENLPAVPDSLKGALQLAAEFAVRGDADEAFQRFRDLATRTLHPAAFNGLGVVQEMRDEMGPAVRAYHRAVRSDPHEALYRLNYGLALRKIGNFARSLEELLRAHELQPGWLKTSQEAASAYELLERHEEALVFLNQCLLSQPDDGTLIVSKARHLLALHRVGEAKLIVQELLKRDPEFYFAWSLLAEIHHDERDLKAAVEDYRKFLAVHPKVAGQWFNYGLVLYRSRDNAEAESAFRRALALNPEDLQAPVYLAKVLQEQGRLEEAIDELQIAIRRSPRHGAFHVQSGAALALLGRTSEAETAFQRAIDLDSDDASAYGNLSILRARQGRTEDAIELARRAVELQPNDHRVRNILGLHLQRSNRLAEAEEEFLMAIDLSQDDYVPLFNLGRLKHFSGNLDEGEKYYRKALSVEPREPEIWNNLGSLVKSRGDLKQAEEFWRKAVEVGPLHALAHTNLADLLLASGRASESLELIRIAAKLNPGSPRVWMILGWAARDSGQVQEAEPAFRKAAALAPNDLWAQDSLLQFLLVQGNGSEEVVALALRIRGLAPDDEIVALRLGWAYALAKKFELAEPLLVSGLIESRRDNDPFYAPMWAALAEVYEYTGRKDKAIETYKISLSLNPKEQRTLEGLKRLGG